MNDFQLQALAGAKRYRVQPMRGAKQIDRDVRRGGGAVVAGRDGDGRLRAQFPGLGAPSYR